MAKTESQLISWTVESNEAGSWALFARIAGKAEQMTTWFESRDELIAKLKGRFELTEPPAV